MWASWSEPEVEIRGGRVFAREMVGLLGGVIGQRMAV